MIKNFEKYFDSNATLPMSEFHKQAFLEQFGPMANASSIHGFGRRSKDLLEECREKCARYLKVDHREIFFTSGATEANHLAIRGLAEQSNRNSVKSSVYYSQLEHPCVLDAVNQASFKGVIELSINANGEPDFPKIIDQLKANDLLICMAANNETGRVFDLGEIAEICRSKACYLHADMVQTPGKLDISLDNISTASFSGHKFGAAKGIGIFYKQRGLEFPPIFNGSQEKGFRAGTENLLGILSLSIAIDELQIRQSQWREHSLMLREHFEDRIKNFFPWATICCERQARLVNTSNVCFEGLDGESLLFSLDLMGYGVSLGSACSSGSVEPSHVLLALGYDEKRARSSLRFSFSHHNTKESVDDLVDDLRKIITRLPRK
tara:strand:+ start:586 stop:1722 length:1137 start_codon:yes stop_codon:yes gene_type:complete